MNLEDVLLITQTLIIAMQFVIIFNITKLKLYTFEKRPEREVKRVITTRFRTTKEYSLRDPVINDNESLFNREDK